MDHLLKEIATSLTLLDVAGLVTVLGLAVYGLTGSEEDSSFESAGSDGD